MKSSRLRIGTCSWKYESWRGIFYPSRGPVHYLREYAAKLDTVEIDQWFWSLFDGDAVKLPDPRTVREYREAVPGDFRFTVKVPNSITLTHHYRKSGTSPLRKNPHFLSPELFREFTGRIQPLKEQIGVLIFQFEYLNKKKMTGQKEFIRVFSTFTQAISREYPMALEIRNPNYLNDQYFKFLHKQRLGPVFMQGYYMPDIFPLIESHRSVIGDRVIIRLMGPDRKGIEQQTRKQWNRIVQPRDKDLDRLIPLLDKLRAQKVEVYLNINNHYEGSAPLTIQRIEDRLKA